MYFKVINYSHNTRFLQFLSTIPTCAILDWGLLNESLESAASGSKKFNTLCLCLLNGVINTGNKIISLAQWNLSEATTQNAKIEWLLTGGGRLQD